MFKRGLLVLMFLLAMVGIGFGATLYDVVDLGTLGGDWSVAYDLNDSGQVVGGSKAEGWGSNAFLYEDGVMKNIGSRLGYPSATSEAYSINNSGQVIGKLYNLSRHTFSYQEDGYAGPIFRGTGFSVGDSGIVVGHNFWHNPSFFLDNNIVIIDQGNDGAAYDVNDSDQIVGGSGLPFFYEDGVMERIGTPGVDSGAFYGISDSGHIVGVFNDKASSYIDGIFKNIGLPLEESSVAYGVNDSDQIVGRSSWNGGSGFFYENGNSYDLNDLAVFSDIKITEGRAVNSSGQIAANGIVDGERRGLLLNPIVTLPDGAEKVEAPTFEIPDFEGGDLEWGQLEVYGESVRVNRDTVVIVHGWNTVEGREELPEWVFEMNDVLRGEGKNVLLWNWQKVAYDPGIFPEDAQDFVPGEAINLSRELSRELGEDYTGSIHFIGHSLGAGVAARTAIYMQDKFEVERLTLLDGPTQDIADSDVQLNNLLSQVSPNIFVENYVSEFGMYYVGGENVANYGLNGGFNDSGERGHVWVHDWYTETIGDSSLNWGYGRMNVGDAGSLLYQTGEYSFGIDIGDAYTRVPLTDGSSSEVILSQDHLDFASAGSVWEYDGVYTMLTNSPVYLTTEFWVPEDSYLSFDVSMTNWYEGDKFELWMNDFLLYSVYADVFEIDDWFTISDIDLSRWVGEVTRLTFGLIAEVDGAYSSINIRGIRVYGNSSSGAPVPEPATMLLFGIGLIALAGISRRKRR